MEIFLSETSKRGSHCTASLEKKVLKETYILDHLYSHKIIIITSTLKYVTSIQFVQIRMHVFSNDTDHNVKMFY